MTQKQNLKSFHGLPEKDFPKIPGREEIPFRHPPPTGIPEPVEPPLHSPPVRDPPPTDPSLNLPIPQGPIDNAQLLNVKTLNDLRNRNRFPIEQPA